MSEICCICSISCCKKALFPFSIISFSFYCKWNELCRSSRNGMRPGIVNTHGNQHACHCHKCNVWADKFWKLCCSCASVVSHRMDICTVAMLYYRMVWPGKEHPRNVDQHFNYTKIHVKKSKYSYMGRVELGMFAFFSCSNKHGVIGTIRFDIL